VQSLAGSGGCYGGCFSWGKIIHPIVWAEGLSGYQHQANSQGEFGVFSDGAAGKGKAMGVSRLRGSRIQPSLGLIRSSISSAAA